MKCSVCIPTYHRPEQLNRLLASLYAMRDERIGEVIVAVTGGWDSSANVDTGHICRMYEIANIELRTFSGLDGLASAKELFKRESKSEIVLILDDDMLIGRDYFDLMTRFDEPLVGVVGGSIHTPLDIAHYGNWSYDPIPNPDVDVFNKITVENGVIALKDKYQVYMLENPMDYECECMVGGALFFRKKLLEIDSYFNSGASVYEEFDTTYGIYRRGYRLICSSSRVCYHLRADGGGCREKSREKQRQRLRNARYLAEKYGL